MNVVAPVSRSIRVTNLHKSLAFYRDVLGFEVRADAEVVRGPARIEFVEAEAPPVPRLCSFKLATS